MSRSYKKTPIVKDNIGGKTGKRFANKKVRKFKGELLKGGEYKKISESWNINDFISYYTLEDAIADWFEEEKDYVPKRKAWRHRRYKTLENWIIAWKKMMLNK